MQGKRRSCGLLPRANLVTNSHPMAELSESLRGKFTGLTVGVSGLGKAELTQRISKNQETEVYSTSRPGILVKMFDLDCGKPDEVSFGAYTSYNLELANFQFLQQIEALRVRVPTFYGSSLDGERKIAYIVMECVFRRYSDSDSN